ncbi:adenosylcobalamin-dependent ribonucleoside-diphosphate reductase, partial [Salinibacter ruber]
MSQNPSSTDSSAADVAAPAESTNGHASNGHRVNTRSGRNGSHQYQLSESDLITDDRTNDDIFETEISEEVYGQNYQYGTDDRVPDTWYRNARAMAQVEDDTDMWTQRFYQLLSGKGLGTGPFPFTPGGRIFANAGTGLGKATLINCFVSGFQGHDQDSMDEIQAELTRQAKILASEGGYGFCAHIMRPRGARIGGVGSMTPGAVQMLDVWNKQAATIVAGSGMKSDRDDVKDKIRKGAQMVTMGIWHPDIIEFIEAKQEPGRLHKFNMSVLITDEFMEAVKNDDTWALRFPDYENEKEFYKQHWDGNLKAYQEKGGTVKTWTDPATGEPAVYEAREIWNRIMDSTYNRNEPGVIFVDTINKENNLGYVEHINATNPCGEQVLPVGGVCLLGNLNVTQLVDREAGTIDYDLVDDLVPLAVRFLDNVNDLSYVPLEEQQRNLQEKRRIGLGHYGDGSALMMMKTRYGSEEGARVMREFQEHLANQAYQASARLAEEKGAFPLFDKDEYLSSPFVQRLSDKTKEMIGDLGLRNSHLLSIQPTGNTSTLGNAPSSGIEPVFMHSYIRTSEQPALPDGINRPPMSPNAYEVGQDIDADGTAWTAEEQGDETVLRCQEEGHTHWQIHPTRDICKDQEVKDYAVRHMETDGTWDPDADWAVTTRDLDVDDHLTQMKALAPFVDSSMSKTVNVPNDYPFEDFKELYKKAHDTGVIKGVTTYRAGTMSAVLSG